MDAWRKKCVMERTASAKAKQKYGWCGEGPAGNPCGESRVDSRERAEMKFEDSQGS